MLFPRTSSTNRRRSDYFGKRRCCRRGYRRKAGWHRKSGHPARVY
nr:MAG TPA: hypothetical protein [Caudoviricetes sp.]